MNICIVDDEAPLRGALKTMLLHHRPNAIVHEAGSVNEGVALLKNYKPDILFLDVEMGDGDGFDLLNAVELNCPVVFVTAHDQYAVKAFRFNAIDYILKPIDPDDVQNTLEKVFSQDPKALSQLRKTFNNNDFSRIVLSDNLNVHLIALSDIVYCQAIGNYTHFYLAGDKELVISKTLKYYDELLSDQNFVRVHQSYLINMEKLERYSKKDGGEAIMKNGHIVPVATRKRETLLEVFKSYRG